MHLMTDTSAGPEAVVMRRYWMNTNYLVAITLAMVGWLWFIAWCALRLI
jgi:hypothetical protein